MTPLYLIAYDHSIPSLFIIALTPEGIKQSQQYDDFEDFLSTFEDKYGFTASSSQ